jgi:hypothetical protein
MSGLRTERNAKIEIAFDMQSLLKVYRTLAIQRGIRLTRFLQITGNI